MLVANFTSKIPTMGNTKTYEDWSTYLGAKPYRFGVVARLYPQNTINFITDGMRNIFYNDANVGKYQTINSLFFEWEIDNGEVKKIEFAEKPTELGENGNEITMAFKENYYQKYDIFMIDESRQQCQVLSRPIRKRDDYWEVQVRLIDNDYSSILDDDACEPGMTTTWKSMAVPELSEEGYSKFMSSWEKHRNAMTTFRADISWSSLYAAQENMFLKVADDRDATKTEGVFKMLKKEKELMESFMYGMNTGLLCNKGNVDVNMRATISDPDTSRQILIGDGVIPQVEAFASKYLYNNRPTIGLLNRVFAEMAEKSQEITGNKYTVICTQKFWNDIQETLGQHLANAKTDGCYFYSKSANRGEGGYVKVGATYDTYRFGGNEITFIPDKALTREYGNKGYALCLDLTADKTNNVPAIAKFTLTGKEFTTNKIIGVQGEDGKSSGNVSTNVAGSKMVMMSTAGVAVFAPFRSFIIMEA